MTKQAEDFFLFWEKAAAGFVLLIWQKSTHSLRSHSSSFFLLSSSL